MQRTHSSGSICIVLQLCSQLLLALSSFAALLPLSLPTRYLPFLGEDAHSGPHAGGRCSGCSTGHHARPVGPFRSCLQSRPPFLRVARNLTTGSSPARRRWATAFASLIAHGTSERQRTKMLVKKNFISPSLHLRSRTRRRMLGTAQQGRRRRQLASPPPGGNAPPTAVCKLAASGDEREPAGQEAEAHLSRHEGFLSTAPLLMAFIAAMFGIIPSCHPFIPSILCHPFSAIHSLRQPLLSITTFHCLPLPSILLSISCSTSQFSFSVK